MSIQTYEELQLINARYNIEFELINTLQIALIEQKNIQEIYNLIGDKLGEAFDTSTIILAQFDHKSGQEIFTYYWEDRKRLHPEPRPINRLLQKLIISPQLLLVNTLEEFAKALEVLPEEMNTTGDSAPMHSAVIAPLMLGSVAYGHLSLQNFNDHAFSDRQSRLLETVVNAASVVLENIQLRDVIKQYNSELEALRQAGLSLTSSLSEVLRTILQITRDLFDAFDVHIFLYDDEKLSYVTGYYAGQVQEKPIGEPDLDGLSYRVARSGEMINIDNTQTYPLHASISYIEDKAIVGAPLKVGQHVVGVMSLSRYKPYSDNELRSLTMLADQLALAIYNSNLVNALVDARRIAEAKAWREAALFRLSATLANTLDETEICQNVVEGLQDDALGYQLVSIFLIDPKTGDRVAYGVTDRTNQKIGWRIAPGKGLSERPLLNGQLHYSPDVSAETNYVEGLQGSEVDVPLQIGNEIIGILLVESRDKDAFDQNDFDILTTVANQISIAIERARLYTKTQSQLKDLASLNRIISTTTTAQDPIAVLEIVCHELAEILRAPQAAAAIFNSQHTALTVVAEYLSEGRPSAIGLRIPVTGNPSAEYVLKHKVPLAISDVMTDARMISVREVMKARGTVSILLLPLQARDEVVGTIGLDFIETRVVTEQEIALAFDAARSTAQSLANARLFDQTNATLAELQRVTKSQRYGRSELDRYLPRALRETIENTYYAKINEQGKLDNVIDDPTFLDDPTNHMLLYSDHGVVHVRNVAENILNVLDTINGVLISHRDRRTLDFMKGYGVMLAYNHDIGMVDFSAMGRTMHPEFAAKKVFEKAFDEIVDTIWDENWGNVAWRLINLVEQGTYDGDPKLMLRELLAMSIGHSKSKVPVTTLNDPLAVHKLMLRTISTEIQHLYYQQVSTSENTLNRKRQNRSEQNYENRDHQVGAEQTEYAQYHENDPLTHDNSIDRFYKDFEKEAFAWLLSEHPALQNLTQDVVDTIRALRVADALRQRGDTLKTSGGYQIFIDQNTANAVIALQKGSGEVLMFEVNKTHSIGEANIASSEVTLGGDLRISFHRGAFRNDDTTLRAALSCALIVDDIQRDIIDSFTRSTQPSTQRKVAHDMQILIEETNDSLVFSEMVLAELIKINPELNYRSRIVPSLSGVTDEERQRYLTGIELDGSVKQKQQIVTQMTRRGHRMPQFDQSAAFIDVRLVELRNGDVLLEVGAPPGFVYVPMSDGLLSLPLGGYQPQKAPPWIALGNTRVIRGAVQESKVIAEQDIQLLMIPRAIYLKHWHDTYGVGELAGALKELYREGE